MIRRISILLALAVLLCLAGGLGPEAAAAQTAASAVVDAEIWAALRADPARQATFVVVMRPRVAGDPASTIPAQMALEGALDALQRTGGVASYRPRYGPNEIVVRGSAGAVRFLADWPEVEAIRARAGAAPEVASFGLEAIQATGSISGKVTTAAGTPIAGISVRAYRQTDPITWEVAGNITTGTNGTYFLSSLAAGVYVVRFQSDAGAYVTEFYNDKASFSTANRFDVASGQAVSNINASLTPAGKINGKVTAISGGGAIADINVTAFVNVGGSWQAAGNAASGSDGNYTILGLAVRSYIVRFSDVYTPPRYISEYYNNVTVPAQATLVSVAAGQSTKVDASLGGYGKITGAVTGPNGATPLGAITVDVYVYNQVSSTWDWLSSTTTDSSGNYEANGLETRPYRAEFSDPKGQYLGEFYNNKATIETADNIAGVLGGTVGGINASLALKTVTISRSLVSGWNLLSLPLDIGSPAPSAAFLSLSPNYSLIQAYDGCQPSGSQWKSYDPSLPPPLNPLQAVTNKQGLWVQVTAPDALEAGGVWPLSTSITLCPGWNLIGYPSITAKPVGTALAGIAGKYNLVYGYDASDTADPWKKYNPSFPVGNDLTVLEPWRGYWIRMTQAATLVIDGR